jgi:hypothetical protein
MVWSEQARVSLDFSPSTFELMLKLYETLHTVIVPRGKSRLIQKLLELIGPIFSCSLIGGPGMGLGSQLATIAITQIQQHIQARHFSVSLSIHSVAYI